MNRTFALFLSCVVPVAISVACGSSSPSNPGTGGTTDGGPGSPHEDAGGSSSGSAAPDGGEDAAAAACPVVTTANGPVESLTISAPCRYLGIPYAAPPTGALRWKAPQPPASWTAPRASAAASGCAQVASEFGTVSASEDCLYLNVWSPTPQSTTPAPVMVFVHGGSFLYGSGTYGLYDGNNLAVATGHVVVTINYRLGALGFLSNPELRAEDPTNPSAGDYGIEDQIAAFKWVQANAAAFGGDPKNVTIFGESAGGTSMFLHLVSPKSAGLFARVIAESGAASNGSPAIPQAVADTNGAAFATAMGCDSSDAGTLLTCLRATAVSDILNVTESATSTLGWWPSVDGFVVPADPVTLFASGAINKVPTIVGTNKDEGSLFVAPSPPTDDTSYLAFANGLLAGQGAAIVAQYPIASYGSSYQAAATAAMTDGIFACPTRRVARGVVATGTPVYRYDFVHAMEDPPFLNEGAFHGSELVFVLGNPIAGVFKAQADEVPLQTLMMGYWGNMATSGNPNTNPSAGAGSLFTWPAYDATTETDIVLDLTPSTETQLKKSVCDFWDGIEQ